MLMIRVGFLPSSHSLASYGGKKSICSSARPSSAAFFQIAVALASGCSCWHGVLGLDPRDRIAQALLHSCEATQRHL